MEICTVSCVKITFHDRSYTKENLVLLGNAEAFKALEDGYKGSSSRYEAIEMAVDS